MNLDLLYKFEEILDCNQVVAQKYSDINEQILRYGDKIKNNEEFFKFIEEVELVYKNIFNKLDILFELISNEKGED